MRGGSHRHRSSGLGVGSLLGMCTQSRSSGQCRCGSSRHCCADTRSALGKGHRLLRGQEPRLGWGQGRGRA